MIDTHAHLDDKQFDRDRDEVIQRAFSGEVNKIINIGADLEGSEASVELAGKYEKIFAAVGLHPHVFNQDTSCKIPRKASPRGRQDTNNRQIQNSKFQTELNEIRRLVKEENVVAIGEIGLDYYFLESHDANRVAEIKEAQKEGFLEQTKIAQENNLPVIIHCRGSKENPTDAFSDLYEIISDTRYAIHDMRLVFHCYAGDTEFTKKLLKHENILFSFTGNITYKVRKDVEGTENDIREVVKLIPMDKIMVETDCPYLAPLPHRGERNEPLYIREVLKKVAEIKMIDYAKAEKITEEVSTTFFEF